MHNQTSGGQRRMAVACPHRPASIRPGRRRRASNLTATRCVYLISWISRRWGRPIAISDAAHCSPDRARRTPRGIRHDDWGWQAHEPWLDPAAPSTRHRRPQGSPISRRHCPRGPRRRSRDCRPRARRGWSATCQLRPALEDAREACAPPRTRSARGGLPRRRTPWPTRPAVYGATGKPHPVLLARDTSSRKQRAAAHP